MNRKRLHQSRAQRETASWQAHPLILDDVSLHGEGSGRPSESTSTHERHDSIFPYVSSNAKRQIRATSSSMEFAKAVIGDDDINDVGGDASAPGGPEFHGNRSGTFTLITIPMLPPEVINSGIQAYFDRFHWFVLLLHEPSFVARASSISSRTTWAQEELCDVVLVLMVVVLGLQCAANDASWQGHAVLQSHSVDANVVVQCLLKEVGMHLYEVLTWSRIEAYQILMLLDIYHVYFGSLNFARHISCVPAQIAHGLGLHRDKINNVNDIAYQVGIRCWNHAVVGELFAAMMYGKHTSTEHAFSQFRALSELDEKPMAELTARLPIIAGNKHEVSVITFHVLKFELYGVIQEMLQRTKALDLGPEISITDLTLLIEAVNLAEARLARWRENLAPVFNPVHWGKSDPWDTLQVEDGDCTAEDRSCRRNLALQGIILQVLHDSAIILAHRPLLQCRISVSDHPSTGLQHVPDSLGISAQAALRISRVPISRFKHQLALSFVFMHLFTAGVILCVPPTCLPYSQLASESKAGVLAIISASRAMKSTNSIARHTDQLLTKLYQKTMQREMDTALSKPTAESTQWPFPRTGDVSASRPPQLANTETQQSRNIAPTIPSATPATQHSTSTFLNNNQPMVQRAEETFEPVSWEVDASAHPAFSYALFDSSSQRETVGSNLNEHLEEAFGAFEQSKSMPLSPLWIIVQD